MTLVGFLMCPVFVEVRNIKRYLDTEAWLIHRMETEQAVAWQLRCSRD